MDMRILSVIGKLTLLGRKTFAGLERIGSDPRKFKIAKIAVICAIFLFFLTIIGNRHDPDLGWHVRVGDWILQNRELPHGDIFSHTMPGYEWVDHEWAAECLLAWANGRNLGFAVNIFFTLLITGPFVYWVWKARSYPFLFAAVTGAFSLGNFVAVRAAMLDFFLFFLMFEIFRSRYSRVIFNRTPGFFALAVFLALVWANLHASVTIGIFLAGCFAFFHHLRSFRLRRKVDFKNIFYDISLLAAMLSAVLANPYGFGMFKLVFDVIRAPLVREYISEWQPAILVTNWQVALFYIPFLFFAANFRKKINGVILSVAAVFFAMFFVSARHYLSFFVVAMPIVENGVYMIRQDLLKVRIATAKMRKFTDIISTFIILAFISLFAYMAFWLASLDEWVDYPRQAMPVLREYARNHDVVLLNDYNWGGYILHAAPEIKVFIDGRMSQWIDGNGDSAMKDYIDFAYAGDENRVNEVIDKRNINTIMIDNVKAGDYQKEYSAWGGMANLLRNLGWSDFFADERGSAKGTNNSLGEMLEKNGWSILYRDDTAVIYVKE